MHKELLLCMSINFRFYIVKENLKLNKNNIKISKLSFLLESCDRNRKLERETYN